MVDVQVGQQVWVIHPASRYRPRPPELARVLSVKRVWIEVENADMPQHPLRFRKDNQTDGSNYSSLTTHFRTEDQHRARLRRDWALRVLADNFVEARPSSPYNLDDFKLIALAEWLDAQPK